MRAKQRQVNRGMIQEVSWASALTDRELSALTALGSIAEIDAGTVLAKEGTPGREAFLILSGRAEVAVDGEVITTLASGAFVGEMALLDRGLRSATVTAATHMVVLAFDPRSFSRAIENPAVSRQLQRQLAARLRATQ